MRPLLLALTVAAHACSTRQESPSGDSGVGTGAPVTDTVVGTLSVVGSEPATLVSLLPRGGAPAVILGGSALPDLRRAAGTEVWVSGTRSDARSMDVTRFEVRSVHGIPAVDGVIAREGESFVLITQDGRRVPVPRLPHELRERVGARVWLAGPLERDPELFGVVSPDVSRHRK